MTSFGDLQHQETAALLLFDVLFAFAVQCGCSKGLRENDFVVFGQFFPKSGYLVVLLMHKMFLINCEVDI